MDPNGPAPPCTSVSASANKDDKAGAPAEPTNTNTTPTPAPAPAPALMSDAPDPDEDDLSDLDDMLDDFSRNVQINSENPSVATTTATTTSKTTTAESDAGASFASETSAKDTAAAGFFADPNQLSDEEFARQIQNGMEDLLGGIEESPELSAELKTMLQNMPHPDATSTTSSGAGAGTSTEASFQDTIRRTMERMKNSGDQATAAAAEGGADDLISELLKQVAAETGSGDGTGGGADDDEFSKILMGMMQQLTNKDILHEPMKELRDKFPDWLDKNKGQTPADELARYRDQYRLAGEIVARFESASYSDSNAADREYIVERMQKMQELGSPPSELVGDLDTAQEAFAGADDQCNPQ